MSTTSSWGLRSDWPAKGFNGLFDYAAGSHRRAVALLVLVALVAFLPGFFQIPPVDRDEAYFAQATKQMIETGDYVDIRYQDDVRYRKPVGIYWLQAAVVNTASALGLPDADTTIWLYRMPSLLGAIGAVLATYWCALAFVSRRGAVLAALMLAASTILGVEARLAKTDAVLLFTVVARHDRLGARLSGAASRRGAAGSRSAGGVLDRACRQYPGQRTAHSDGRRAGGGDACRSSTAPRAGFWHCARLPGIAWMFLLVLPWFIAIYWRVGSQFLVASVGEDMLAKVAGAQETHGAPPGLYLLLFFATFFPALDAGGLGGACGLGGAARARRAIPAGLAGAVLDRIRTGGDQAAALCAAALSGDRHSDRRRR